MMQQREKRGWHGKPRTQSYRGDALVTVDTASRQTAAAKQYRAALDALFDKKPDGASGAGAAAVAKVLEQAALPRVIDTAAPTSATAPVSGLLAATETEAPVLEGALPEGVATHGVEAVPAGTVAKRATKALIAANKRQELLRRIDSAQGSRAVTDAVEAFLAAGHELPDEQDVFLQILEHRDEVRVRDAIVQLERMLAGQLPKRKPVLVQRLRRIEENADESETRDAAAALRRRVA